jgi:hypothetical protein
MLVKFLGGFLLTMTSAVQAQTNFGERLPPGAGAKPLVVSPHSATNQVTDRRPAGSRSDELFQVLSVAQRWGRVSSTHRSRARNRAVGGVANSYHLSGRALDLVRAPGVRHHQVDAALRAAGFRLLESLDEGDHSHFAFSWGEPAWRPLAKATPPVTRSDSASTSWKWVYAPRNSSR